MLLQLLFFYEIFGDKCSNQPHINSFGSEKEDEALSSFEKTILENFLLKNQEILDGLIKDWPDLGKENKISKFWAIQLHQRSQEQKQELSPDELKGKTYAYTKMTKAMLANKKTQLASSQGKYSPPLYHYASPEVLFLYKCYEYIYKQLGEQSEGAMRLFAVPYKYQNMEDFLAKEMFSADKPPYYPYLQIISSGDLKRLFGPMKKNADGKVLLRIRDQNIEFKDLPARLRTTSGTYVSSSPVNDRYIEINIDKARHHNYIYDPVNNLVYYMRWNRNTKRHEYYAFVEYGSDIINSLLQDATSTSRRIQNKGLVEFNDPGYELHFDNDWRYKQDILSASPSVFQTGKGESPVAFWILGKGGSAVPTKKILISAIQSLQNKGRIQKSDEEIDQFAEDLLMKEKEINEMIDAGIVQFFVHSDVNLRGVCYVSKAYGVPLGVNLGLEDGRMRSYLHHNLDPSAVLNKLGIGFSSDEEFKMYIEESLLLAPNTVESLGLKYNDYRMIDPSDLKAFIPEIQISPQNGFNALVLAEQRFTDIDQLFDYLQFRILLNT